MHIGLALGSGSARGLAHLGVIRALEDAGIRPRFIAGTSMGALIGAVHAADKLAELQATFEAFDWKTTLSFFDMVLPKSGLLDGAKVSALVRSHIHGDLIESLPKRFAAVATDIATGEEVVIRAGDIIEAVRASISVPGIFTPVRSNGRILVDGGLTNPVPVSAVRAMGASFVIAVDLNHQIVAGKNMRPLLPSRKTEIDAGQAAGAFSRWVGGYRRSMADLKQRLLARDDAIAAQLRKWNSPAELVPSIFEVLLASINIMETAVTQARLTRDPPDLLIRPPLGHIRFLEFARAEEIIRIGYETTRETLAALPPDQLSSLVDVGAGSGERLTILQQSTADRPGP